MGLTDHAQIPALDMVLHKLAHAGPRKVTRRRHAGHLE